MVETFQKIRSAMRGNLGVIRGLLPKEHRGRFNALTTVIWSPLYGGGNYLGGALFQSRGVGSPFLVAAAPMAVGASIAVFTLREPETREG